MAFYGVGQIAFSYMKSVGADVLVEPQYIIEKRGFLRGGSVTVTGFPAKYTGFHPMTPDEARIAGQIKDNGPKKHKKKFLFF